MAEDSLILGLDFDTTKAEQRMKRLDEEFEREKRKLQEINKERDAQTATIEKQKARMEKLKQIEDEQLKILRKKREYEANGGVWTKAISKSANRYGREKYGEDWSNNVDVTRGKIDELEAKMPEAEAELAKIDAQREKQADKLKRTYEQALGAHEQVERAEQRQVAQAEKLAQKQEQVRQKTEETANAQNSMTPALSNAGKSLEKFTNRIKGLIKRVFIFSLITMALRKLRKAIAEMVGKDSELSQYIAQIKGNLAVMGRTLFESLKPVISWLLQKVAYLTQLLAVILAKVLKKDVKQMANMAKSSAKTAKNAEKTTAAFDTLQTIDTSSKDSESGTSASFEQFDAASWTDEQLAKIMAVAGVSLLAIGLILTFTGNIPLGIAAMAAGVAMLVTAAKMSNEMEGDVKAFITKVMVIAGGALLALGIILCVAGVIPLGIAAIVAGVGLLVGAVALNWGAITEKIKEHKGKIMAVVSTMAIIIGIILLITGVAAPLGLGLILAGAAMFNAVPQEDKDWLAEKIKGAKDALVNAWNWFKSWISEKGSNIWAKWSAFWENLVNNPKEVWAKIVNVFIDAVNWALGKIESVVNGLSSFLGMFGLNISPISIPRLNPYIPQYANGSVIAGGKPHLAILGDQPKGQTNIEAPLDTIKEAVKSVLGEQKINIEFTGSLSQLARVLNPEIKKEQRRASIW